MQVIPEHIIPKRVSINMTERMITGDYLMDRRGLTYNQWVGCIMKADYQVDYQGDNLIFEMHYGMILFKGIDKTFEVALCVLEQYFIQRGLFNGKLYRMGRSK